MKYLPMGLNILKENLILMYLLPLWMVIFASQPKTTSSMMNMPNNWLSLKKLIEPFFRIHPPVESFYSKEKFSLGLGLTMVDFILHRHNGMFFIRNAIDHTTEVKADCIIAEVFLPIQNDK